MSPILISNRPTGNLLERVLWRANNTQLLRYTWHIVAMLCILFIVWTIISNVTSDIANALAPVAQQDLATNQIYAYRDWQSVGIRVKKGDEISIRADGTWHYTPDDYHGPEGHPRYTAPPFYPMSGPGGSLIGRIGERGGKFYVGQQSHFLAQHDGMLYFRINDDKLTDNDGFITVKIEVTEWDQLDGTR